MSKKILISMVVLVLLASIAYAGTQVINVNFPTISANILGEQRDYSNKPFVYNGELYIPLSETTSRLGVPMATDLDGNPTLGKTKVSLRDMVPTAVDGWISWQDDVYWGNIVVNNVTYANAYRKNMVGIADNPISVDFALNQAYSVFSGKLGLEDLSLVKNKPVQFRVFGDGELLYEATVSYDSSHDFTSNVSGVDLLRLEMSAADNSKTGTLAIMDAFFDKK